MRNRKEKVDLQKKIHGRICVRDITFMATRLPSYINFFPSTPILLKKIKTKEKQKLLLHSINLSYRHYLHKKLLSLS